MTNEQSKFAIVTDPAARAIASHPRPGQIGAPIALVMLNWQILHVLMKYCSRLSRNQLKPHLTTDY